MWLDVLLSRTLTLPTLRVALADALGVPVGEVAVTDSVESARNDVSAKFLVAVSQRGGRYPMLLSIYALPRDRPASADARRILGFLAERTGATCLVSLDGMAEGELLEIRSRDNMQLVDSDAAEEA